MWITVSSMGRGFQSSLCWTEVHELLEEAWRMTATKRAIRAFDEARGSSRHRLSGGQKLRGCPGRRSRCAAPSGVPRVRTADPAAAATVWG